MFVVLLLFTLHPARQSNNKANEITYSFLILLEHIYNSIHKLSK